MIGRVYRIVRAPNRPSGHFGPVFAMQEGEGILLPGITALSWLCGCGPALRTSWAGRTGSLLVFGTLSRAVGLAIVQPFRLTLRSP
jgi:hypothetical protein